MSSAGDSDPAGNLACVTPARFRAVPSIAHRLALVAAGEAAAAVSLHWPSAWDYAAGHALLRGAGATLLDEQGREVAYEADARSRCVCAFGGREAVARVLLSRPWHTLGMNAQHREGEDFPARLLKGRAEADAGRLARAQGCLLGQLAGDNLGGAGGVRRTRRTSAGATRTARAASWTGESGTSSPASRPTTPRWPSRSPGRSWSGAVSSARRRSRPTASGCARRLSTWAEPSERPCATTRTPEARPTAR